MNDKTPDNSADKTGKKALAQKREERLRAQLRDNMKRRKAQKRARLATDNHKDEQDG